MENLPRFQSKGNLQLLEEPLTALFCSNRCPGDIILNIYNLARGMREAGVPVIGGFQTPMEKEGLYLHMVLRSNQLVVICPARTIENMRVPPDWRGPLKEVRPMVLSPFPASVSRPNSKAAEQRNYLMLSLASQSLIAHAAACRKTGRFARRLVTIGKPVLALGNPANANWLALDVRPSHSIGNFRAGARTGR